MRRPARKAKSKRATRTKKAAKAKKAAAAKKSAKTTRKATKQKTGAKKKSVSKKKMRTLAGGPLGCCTLVGSGPDTQIEGITKEQCRRLAIESGKNDRWVPGKCAQPG